MIYRRRALQRRLDELRDVLDGDAVDKLAERLNRAGKDRVTAMWELVVLHGLSKCGAFRNEVALASLRRPDILFERGALRLTAFSGWFWPIIGRCPNDRFGRAADILLSRPSVERSVAFQLTLEATTATRTD